MKNAPRPVALIILDGFGHNEDTQGNAIAAADTPNWSRLCEEGTRSLVETSGLNVGLPTGQMGNSEVGHLNLGSGRVVHQDYTRISQAIEDGSLQENEVLAGAMKKVAESGHALHLLGLLSPGGVHSHEEHLYAIVRMAANLGVGRICVHAILDGRDMPPRSAKKSIEGMESVLAETGVGRIATLAGRFYSMDRDNRWDRIEKSYRLYVDGDADHQSDTAIDALHAAYERDENDEFVTPTAIGDTVTIRDGDAVVFGNYRADRARQITRAFIDPDFDGFERGQRVALADYVCLTQYHKDFDAPVAFPPLELPNTLGEYIAGLGLKQLRIAETEKYAHVTFFFNGGVEEPFPGEERILIPSPKVRTYDLQPEMSAAEVTDKLVEAIDAGTFDVIICNYANADMVGHTGVFDATVKAIETLDQCLGRVAEALERAGGAMLVTADHGNAEKMFGDDGQAHTAHTTFQVPLLLWGLERRLLDGGVLSDIAPTVLDMMQLAQPPEMTGRSLLADDD